MEVLLKDLNNHEKHCEKMLVKQLEIENEELKIKLLKLQYSEEKENIYKQNLEDIVKIMKLKSNKPKKITSGNICQFLSPFNINSENLKNIIETKFTDKYFYKGQIGIAEFIFDNISKDEQNNLYYICSDVNRYVFNYIDIDGYIKRDYRAEILLNFLCDNIMKKSKELAIFNLSRLEPNNFEDDLKRNEIIEIDKKIQKFKTNNSKFLIELSLLTNDFVQKKQNEFNKEKF
jgi:hypothetical protein